MFFKSIINNYKKFYVFPFWVILFLLSLVYRLVISIQRKRGYKHSYTGLFILSIGNITTGGTGKTEAAAYIVKEYEKRRKTAVILRGYKSENIEEVLIVSKNSDVKIAGDEALLLSERLKSAVIISKKRRKGVEAALKLKKDLVILDDAFQHWDLKRDLNMILIDHTDPFSNFNLIPAGLLREPLSSLKQADVILITKYDEKLKSLSKERIIKKIKEFNAKVPIFISDYRFDKVLYKNKPVPLSRLKGKRLIILAGIGNPGYFISQVKEYLKPVMIRTMLFNDHHFYDQSDMDRINKLLKNDFDYVITTEKDHIKLKNFNFAPLVFRIKLNIYQKEKFFKMIRQKLNSSLN